MHLELNSSSSLDSFFTTFSPSCKPSVPNWISQLHSLTQQDEPHAAFLDKSVLFIGDSVDRFLMKDICTMLGGNYTIHRIDSFLAEASDAHDAKPNGGTPRSCFIGGPSGRQALTMASFFFYGFDERDIWTDKTSTWSSPARYSERWTVFEQAYSTLYGPPESIPPPSPPPDQDPESPPPDEQQPLRSPLFAPKTHPDLVIVNMGLWELARFDRIKEQSQNQITKLDESPPDPITLAPEFVNEYINLTIDFLARVRELLGPKPVLRWRQMHTPTISSGPYFKDPSGKKKKSRARFSPVKVRVLNEAAKYACQVAGERAKAAKGRWWGKRGGQERKGMLDDGRIGTYPVGDLVAPWPTRKWLRDDIHPTDRTGAVVWGSGIFEYLARVPRR